MANNTPHLPAFTRLPPEILVMIADWLMYTLTRDLQIRQLRALRLSCRQYAYLPWLLQHLFLGLRLVASSAHIGLTDFSLLVPYVQRVVFKPSSYSWAMTRDIFREVAEWQAVQPRLEQHGISRRDLRSMGVETFVRDHLDLGDKPLVDDKELSRDYDAYMNRANEEKELYESGRLISAWSSTLRQLPDVEMFRIGDCNYEEDHASFASYRNGHARGEEVCRRVQAPVADALAGTVLASLGEARANIVQLDIKCVQTGDFYWADDGTLDQLDLSKLKKLLFRPRCEEIGEIHSYEEEERIGQRCGLALDQLLKRCSQSIKHLVIFPGISYSPMRFPLDAPRALPHVRSIETGAELRCSAFANFIKDAAELREVHFDGNHKVSGSGTWRQIWRAIRYHPKRMRVEIDQIPCNSAAEVSLTHYTGKEKDEGMQRDEDPWMDIDRSLANYLSNKTKWNGSCRMWFEEGGDGEDGAESEESDLESDESDESDESERESEGNDVEDE